MTDMSAVSGPSAAAAPHESSANESESGNSSQRSTTQPWTPAEDGILASWMASFCPTDCFPAWSIFANKCRNEGLPLPFHRHDEDVLDRCHALRYGFSNEVLDVIVRYRRQNQGGQNAASEHHQHQGPAVNLNSASSGSTQAQHGATAAAEGTGSEGRQATAAIQQIAQQRIEAERGQSSEHGKPKRSTRQRKSIMEKIEAKKRARKRQSNIVIQGDFDFFNVRKTTRGSKVVSFKGEGTVNVPF